MRDDPWTAANRDKEQQKVTIPPRRKPTVETASPPSKPTVSGPFWTGKNLHPMSKAARDQNLRPSLAHARVRAGRHCSVCALGKSAAR